MINKHIFIRKLKELHAKVPRAACKGSKSCMQTFEELHVAR